LQRLSFLAGLNTNIAGVSRVMLGSTADNRGNIRKRDHTMLRLRDIPILGNVYPVVAALGLVAVLVGAVGVDAVYTTNARVRELEEVANRAFFAERANALIYAVVMDSRGVYMSSEAADRAKYGAGVMEILRPARSRHDGMAVAYPA
jgi:sporulation-control protein spo0M